MNNVVDQIPLHEIIAIIEEETAAQNSSNHSNPKRITMSRKESSVYGLLPNQSKEFKIATQEGGFNSGRTYTYRAQDEGELCLWLDHLYKTMAAARHKYKRSRLSNQTLLMKMRGGTLRFYESTFMQTIIAILILCSFVFDLIESELLPDSNSPVGGVFRTAEITFTTIFCAVTLELATCLCPLTFVKDLALNLFAKSANYFKAFYTDPYSLLDLVVVSISVLSVSLSGLPGLQLLRTIRIFRVVHDLLISEGVVEVVRAGGEAIPTSAVSESVRHNHAFIPMPSPIALPCTRSCTRTTHPLLFRSLHLLLLLLPTLTFPQLTLTLFQQDPTCSYCILVSRCKQLRHSPHRDLRLCLFRHAPVLRAVQVLCSILMYAQRFRRRKEETRVRSGMRRRGYRSQGFREEEMEARVEEEDGRRGSRR